MSKKKNILCDGIGGVLNQKLGSFNAKIGGASALFEDMTNFAKDIQLPSIKDINNGIDALNDAFGKINSGIKLGKLGDMAICLGLAGVGFKLDGRLSRIPDWLGGSLQGWLKGLLNKTIGGSVGIMIDMGSNLSNIFNVGEIDNLLSLLGCLEGQCAPSYMNKLSHRNGWQVEESLNKSGLNLSGRSDYKLIDNDWDPNTANKLNQLTKTYNNTNNLLLQSQGYRPDIYHDGMRVIKNNRYWG